MGDQVAGESASRGRRPGLLVAMCVTFTAAVAAYLIANISQPLRFNWGDPWSDVNVMTSGHYFARYGFFRLHFTPVIDVGPLSNDSLRYTHYPPLPDLMNGVEQSLFGAADISVFRIVALVFTFTALAMFFLYVRTVWGKTTALFALPLFAFNLIFLQYADTIHHIPLYWLSGFFALWAGSRWLAESKARYLALVAVGTFFCSVASYDYYFFLPLMLCTTVITMRARFFGRASLKLLMTGAAALLFAVAVKSLLVVSAIGWHAFVADFVFQFQERATAKHSFEYKDAVAPLIFYRLWRFFGPLYFVFVGVHVLAIVDRARGLKAAVPLTPLFVLGAGLPFVIVFAQLFCEQYHPTLAFLPYFAVGGGSILATLWESVSSRKRALAMGCMIFVAGWQLRALARFPQVLFDRSEMHQVQDALVDDHRNFLWTNCLVDATGRYYFDKHAMGAPTYRVLAGVADAFERFGSDEPLSFVEFLHLEKMAFDKLLFGFFVLESRWSWIGNPEDHHADYEPRIAKPYGDLAQIMSELAPPVVDTGNVRVHRITFDMLDRFQIGHLPPGDTRFIDFEAKDSDVYKVFGFGAPEQYGPHHGFAWMHGHQKKRLIFTLHGLKEIPDGPELRTAALRVRLAADHDYKLVASGFGAIDGTTVTLRVNGSEPVGTVRTETPNRRGAQTFEITVPKETLHEGGIQRLELEMSEVEPEYSNGVAIEWLRLDPVLVP